MRLEFGGMGGLGQVIVGADFEAGHLVVQLGLGGEHQDGDVGCLGVGAQPAGDFVAVHLGHHHVQQDQIGAFVHRLAPVPAPRWWPR